MSPDELLELPLLSMRGIIVGSISDALRAEPAALAEYAEPPGDLGIFGPESLAWRVHADLPVMLIGGIAALVFQTLHPLAMAGVAEHSRFKSDPNGRLARTARFVAGTTYGATPFAEQLIGEVQRVHDHVHGVAPDGRQYSANDPDLLAFVLSTEVCCFLASHQRYGRRPLLRREKDRYVDEMRVVAERLGAAAVPTTFAELRDYLRAVEPQLCATPEALDTIAFLRRSPNRRLAAVVGHRFVTDAALELLPAVARRAIEATTHRYRPPPSARLTGRPFTAALRWAIGPSQVAAVAQDRVATAARP